MKMTKKKLAVVSLILCVAAILSMGTLAWFTADDTVTNELKFVTDFKMDLYETDGNGKVIQNKAGETIGRTYNDVRPNATLYKDPTVINKSEKEEQWVRMTVKVTDTDTWKKLGITDLTALFDVADDFDSTWKRYDAPVVTTGDADNGTMTYTFYLLETLKPGKANVRTLFKGIHIPETLTIDQAKEIEDCQIIVKAEAMQASDLGTGVTDAYTAFTNPTKTASN